MNQVKIHPSRDQLAAFGLGQLDSATRAGIECHVAECASCCDVLRHVPNDTLLDRLKATDTSLESPETEIRPAPQPLKPNHPEAPLELLSHPRYRILKLLGIGGMGVVYKAEHRMMERIVALKVIKPSILANPRAVDRFHVEVKAAAKLNHKNIVAAHDADDAGDVHFLVMEYVEGNSLDRVVKKNGPLSVLHATNFIRQAAAGLQHAFEQGMVHRDIKPQNLVLTTKREVKILDFGLARLAREGETAVSDGNDLSAEAKEQLTVLGSLLGTPDYMAPEQINDSRQADIRSDIYSLGCSLYFLLTARVPFPQTKVMDKLKAHMSSEPTPLAELRTDLPDELIAIVNRMLAKNPSRRFQTPAEVVQALAPFARPAAASASAKEPPAPDIIPSIFPELLSPEPENRNESLAATRLIPGPLAWSDAPTFAPHKASTGRSSGRWIIPGILVAACIIGILIAIVAGYAAVKSNLFAQWTGRTGQIVKSQVITPVPSHSKRVLFVLPPADFWYADYAPVRRILEQNGFEVLVASSTRSELQPDPSGGGDSVVPDLLIETAKASEFDAVVFGGGKGIREFVENKSSAAAVSRLVSDMMALDKHVTALCMGPMVLAEVGVLRGKNATCHNSVSNALEERGAELVTEPVVVTGKIITGRDPQSASQFANTLVSELQK